ncbi:hypothetical protein BpHYR1_025007 [Brachionus plicatilis]|uniref:Uncharacterized protein n=1 Tax=Brachionus plicatilis TaxID=10195 RepID=A0A3M7RYV6_BRAPC|nr:hypothetical protein BpHYR1_025007 [Brachionus plicatilis]
MQIDIIENTESTTSQEQNVVCSPIKRLRNESPVWEYRVFKKLIQQRTLDMQVKFLIAKDYSSISPLSVPSEQTFSAGGLFVTKDRTSLDPKSEDTEPSSEEKYEVAPRQTRSISPSECNKAAFVQQTVKNSRGKNRDYQLMIEGLQLTEATQYIPQLDSVKWTRADTQKIQEGEKRFYT